MKAAKSSEKAIQKIIKNDGVIEGAAEYFLEFKKKHPTYETMDAEHNEHFRSSYKLEVNR